MKRFVMLFLTLSILTIPAASVRAAIVGTYDLDNKLLNGWWDELYGPGGLGSQGGSFVATDSLGGSQWYLTGTQTQDASLKSVTDSYYEFSTRYEVYLSLYDTSTFGGPYSDLPNGLLMSATNITRRYKDAGGALTGELEFTLAADPVELLGYTYSLAASWRGVPYSPSFFGPGQTSLDYTDADPWDYIGFQSLSLTISSGAAAVPAPTPVLLLASGLLGLIGIGRKFRKN